MAHIAHLLQQDKIRMMGSHDRQGNAIVHEHPVDIIGHDAERRLCCSVMLRSDNDQQETADHHKQPATWPLGPGSRTMAPGAMQCHHPLSFTVGDTLTPTLSKMRGRGKASVTRPVVTPREFFPTEIVPRRDPPCPPYCAAEM